MALKSDPATWTDPRHRRGLAGEVAASRFLADRGYRILEHRFRVGRFEVDLVAERSGIVAFIEVKTRCGLGYGAPAEAVTWGKRREMTRVASAWEDRRAGCGRHATRFDVVEVMLARDGTVASLRHVEDAFRPGWR